MSQNLQMQIQTSTKKKGSKRRTGDPFDEEELRVREEESMRRVEELKRMEVETMSKEEKVRIKKEELRRLKERLELENPRMSREETPSLLGSDAGAYPIAYAGSAPPAVPPNHDPVTDLINEWIGAPEVSVNRKASKCDRQFNKGDRMYSCPICAYNDNKVFCSDCFNKADHEGHGAELTISDGHGYCDCGHSSAVRRRMVCEIHGVNEPKSYRVPRERGR